MSAIPVVTYTSLFPNREMPQHGVFVAERLRHLVATRRIASTVVASLPWFPSGAPIFGEYGRFARVRRLESWNGIDVHHPRYAMIPKLGTALQAWSLAVATWRCLTRLRAMGRAAVLDAHYFYPDGVAAAWLGRRLGIPVVITARGSDVNVLARNALLRRWIVEAARQAFAVVTVSDALRSRLLGMGVPANHVRTARNGVDLDKFSPGDRAAARCALRLRGFTLLSVGRLVHGKGHSVVIRALERLPDCQLVIAGEGPDRAAIEALIASKGLGSRVRLTGSLRHEELIEYYRAADVLVLASASEGMPNVVLEALACGTPVVATAVGGIPEVLSPEVGRIISAREPAAIAQAIGALREQGPDATTVRSYAERFSWHDSVDAMVELFESAAAARH